MREKTLKFLHLYEYTGTCFWQIQDFIVVMTHLLIHFSFPLLSSRALKYARLGFDLATLWVSPTVTWSVMSSTAVTASVARLSFYIRKKGKNLVLFFSFSFFDLILSWLILVCLSLYGCLYHITVIFFHAPRSHFLAKDSSRSFLLLLDLMAVWVHNSRRPCSCLVRVRGLSALFFLCVFY